MGKLRHELINDLLNVRHNPVEDITHSSSGNYLATIAERYKGNNIRIHMHVFNRTREALSDFCAVFQYYGSGGMATSDYHRGVLINPSLSTHDLYKPMLVRIIDCFEPVKGMIASNPLGDLYGFKKTATSSVVWLQPLNRCLMFLAQQSNHFHSVSVEAPTILGSASLFQEYRKLEFPNFFTPCNCCSSQIQHGKLINELVQGRPKIMGDFSNNDAPFIRRQRRAILMHTQRIFPSLRIEFRPDDIISGILPEGILHQGETLNFSFCSLELEAWAMQRVHMLYYPQGDDYGRKETKDAQRGQDSCPHKGRIRAQSKKSCKTQINSQQPEEVKSRTSPSRRCGDCISKHTRSGKTEDA